jgi:hypothetical protein
MESLTDDIISLDLLTALNAIESCQELLKINGALEILDALGVFVAFQEVLARNTADSYLVQSAVVKFFSAVAIDAVGLYKDFFIVHLCIAICIAWSTERSKVCGCL